MTPAVRLVMLLVFSLRLLECRAEPPDALPQFHIGVSHVSLGPVNHNDASASLKVWTATITRERQLQIPVQIDLMDAATLEKAMALGQLHAVSLSTEELVRTGEQPEFIFVAAKDHGIGEHYVVLVRRDADIHDLAGLRGGRLVRHVSAHTSAALPWLETLLAEARLGAAKDLLREIAEIDNPSKAVLRVFFGQSEACLVTTNAYAIACELNPQIARKTRVLASSPKLVSTVWMLCKTYDSLPVSDLEEAVLGLPKTAAGQQVLTVFQASRMEKHPASCLDETRAVFSRFLRLSDPSRAVVQKAEPPGPALP